MSSRGHKHEHVEGRPASQVDQTHRDWLWSLPLAVVEVAWIATICWVVIEAWKALGGAFA